jgi:hypothetical protein
MEDIVRLLIPLALLFAVISYGFSIILGRDAYNQMVGTLAADVVRALFLLPFRLLGWFLRLIKLIP